MVAGGFVFHFTPYKLTDDLSQFLEYCHSSPLFYNQIKKITNLSGQALYNIPKSKLMKLLLSLPNKDEQVRINSQVEQYMSKISLLEKQFGFVR